jgi:hypothetical protein
MTAMTAGVWSTFLVLHGLVHLWYVTLSQRLVPYRPEFGWSGTAGMIPAVVGEPAARTLATILYALAAGAFVAGGAGALMRQDGARAALLGAAVCSSAAILSFWNGRSAQLVENGALGLLINAAVIAILALGMRSAAH